METGKLTRPLVALVVLLGVGASAASALQSSDPVERAKAVARQGKTLLEQMREEVRKEDYEAALRKLGEYRDIIKSAHEGLKASGRDAEKKPNGFKHLQIHIRQSIPQLEQTILSVPVEQREPFQAIRRELDAIDQELVDALFPRRPQNKPGEKKPK